MERPLLDLAMAELARAQSNADRIALNNASLQSNDSSTLYAQDHLPSSIRHKRGRNSNHSASQEDHSEDHSSSNSWTESEHDDHHGMDNGEDEDDYVSGRQTKTLVTGRMWTPIESIHDHTLTMLQDGRQRAQALTEISRQATESTAAAQHAHQQAEVLAALHGQAQLLLHDGRLSIVAPPEEVLERAAYASEQVHLAEVAAAAAPANNPREVLPTASQRTMLTVRNGRLELAVQPAAAAHNAPNDHSRHQQRSTAACPACGAFSSSNHAVQLTPCVYCDKLLCQWCALSCERCASSVCRICCQTDFNATHYASTFCPSCCQG